MVRNYWKGPDCPKKRYFGDRSSAYVQPVPGRTLAFEERIVFLKERGASTLLLPERLETMDAFPLTAMQKISKHALREDIARKPASEKKNG